MSLDSDDYIEVIQAKKQIYVLSSDQLLSNLEEDVDEVQQLTNLDVDDSFLLLKHFNWEIKRIENEYMLCKDLHDKKAGIKVDASKVEIKQVQEQPKTICCQGCLEQKSQFEGLDCGQLFCTDCWSKYIEVMIQSQPPQIFLQCPFGDCNLLLKRSFIHKYIDKNEQLLKIYNKYLGLAYLIKNDNIKHCPFPNCNYIVVNKNLFKGKVQCLCNREFCFNCQNEPHEPLNCKMMREWMEMSDKEFENLKWIKQNTKQCPNCHVFIEKNQGCNHMTCKRPPSGCGYEFCWLCLENWQKHGSQTGGFYQCNKFMNLNEEKKSNFQQSFDQIKHKQEFYLERFKNIEIQQKYIRNIIVTTAEKLKAYTKNVGCNQTEVYQINQAAEYLLQAKNVLKYTYCYGYFIDQMKLKELYEYSQGQFEQSCEILLELIEKDLDQILTHKLTDKQFIDFRQKVLNLKCCTEKSINKFLEWVLQLS